MTSLYNLSSKIITPCALANQLPRSFILCALISSMVLSCSVNPATGGANLVLMTEKKEKRIGQEEHEKVLASMPLFDDEELMLSPCLAAMFT